MPKKQIGKRVISYTTSFFRITSSFLKVQLPTNFCKTQVPFFKQQFTVIKLSSSNCQNMFSLSNSKQQSGISQQTDVRYSIPFIHKLQTQVFSTTLEKKIPWENQEAQTIDGSTETRSIWKFTHDFGSVSKTNHVINCRMTYQENSVIHWPTGDTVGRATVKIKCLYCI